MVVINTTHVVILDTIDEAWFKYALKTSQEINVPINPNPLKLFPIETKIFEVLYGTTPNIWWPIRYVMQLTYDITLIILNFWVLILWSLFPRITRTLS